MAEQNAAVGIFNSRREAESSIRTLHIAGFDMKRLSIVCRDVETGGPLASHGDADDSIEVWDSQAGFWGGTRRLVFGSASFLIPGLGTLTAFGPLVYWLVGALDSGLVVSDLGVLGSAFLSLGFPRNCSLQYEAAITADKCLVITHGAPFDVSVARAILVTSGATHYAIHPGVLCDVGGGS
ncbi:MAG: hypothetical protein HXX12_08730 [Geothrix sp.]|uniref:hypothetical protein n=1 Tax=Geothrix sp. TaxID=1962974 RepID=UPI00183FC809|nr:hypothetical protein [Geothrix sp.]NWJ41039.1 hypothetical protein [Geothrix sp.]WIL20964.1 MAG: hypothetical protein QOZ81_000204 [Geothrix sp.]